MRQTFEVFHVDCFPSDVLLTSRASTGAGKDDAVCEESLRRVREHLLSCRSGAVVCLICLEAVRRTDAVWSCQRSCSCDFHLLCIQARRPRPTYWRILLVRAEGTYPTPSEASTVSGLVNAQKSVPVRQAFAGSLSLSALAALVAGLLHAQSLDCTSVTRRDHHPPNSSGLACRRPGAGSSWRPQR